MATNKQKYKHVQRKGPTMSEREKAAFNKGVELGFCWAQQEMGDLFEIALHNEEAMGGPKRVMGRESIKRVVNFVNKLGLDLKPAWQWVDLTDYCRQKLDDLLEEIFGEEMVFFEERYDMMRKGSEYDYKCKFRERH